jgi:uncharacterized GH25 family protein
MAISKEQLASIINGKAKQLCNPEGDRIVEGYARNTGIGLNDPNPSSYDYDADAFDKMYLSESESEYSQDIQYSNYTASNSRMPEHIKKSMLEQRIDTTSLGQTSVLDSIGIKPLKKPMAKRQIQENVQTAPISNTGGVDYSIIKAIVNECLKEHFSKQTLNESTSLQTIGISNGTISLVDSKGNVFKAKLEKIGNTNDKK